MGERLGRAGRGSLSLLPPRPQWTRDPCGLSGKAPPQPNQVTWGTELEPFWGENKCGEAGRPLTISSSHPQSQSREGQSLGSGVQG